MQRTNYHPNTDALYYGFVSSRGANGMNGSNGQDGMPGGSGAPGSPGTNATSSTHGQNAREMRVVLKRAQFPGGNGIQAHCLTPSDTPAKQEWMLQGIDMIILSGKGGDGGHGGNGGHGGDGGRGMDGMSANQHQSGTRGGTGGSGGNGGNGTSGANGGSGAYIEIEVEEQDMDLLMPIQWDVRGGVGGESGKNGEGGRGGSAGWGGKGSGGRGINGNSGNAILTPGQHGQPGSGRIQVHFESTRELGARHGFYTHRYYFQLLDFDVVDENKDGIFEPGEHVFIQNIRIKNTGGMPTPTKHGIPIHLSKNEWLDRVDEHDEPAYIPPGIAPGEIVVLQGKLKAKIKPPPEPWADPFNVSIQLEFHAMLPGLNGRVIRDFTGRREIKLGYPIVIESVRYPNAVLPGADVTFIWKITNKSTRALGLLSEQKRDVNAIFKAVVDKKVLESADVEIALAEGLQETFTIGKIEPGESVTLNEHVYVSPRARMYHHHNFEVNLCLAPQNAYVSQNNERRQDIVQISRPVLQIAAPYKSHPEADAALLLVVNCNTTLEQINAWHKLLSQSLGKPYEVWNVSLYGGYSSHHTNGTNVLSRFAQKGIIFLGNDFDYFQQGNRAAVDMITPEFAFSLATHGTHFLIASGRSPSAQAWWEQVVYPQFGNQPSKYQNKRQMVLGLRALGLHNKGIPTPLVATRSTKTKGTFEKRSKKTASQVKTKFPLERFQICPILEDPDSICVKQGLPFACRLLSCTYTQPTETAALDSLDLFAIISVLPVQKRIELLIAASQATVANVAADKPEFVVTDLTVLELLKVSIIQDLELEIARYLHEAPWPHHISTSTCDKHLKGLHAFLSSWPEGPLDPVLSETVIDIFSHLIRSVRLTGFGEAVIRFGYRKTNLRKYLMKRLASFLENSVGQSAGQYMQKSKTIAGDSKVFKETITRISTNTQVSAGDCKNRWICSSNDVNIVTDIGKTTAMKSKYDQNLQRFNGDAEASKYVLSTLVSPYPAVTAYSVTAMPHDTVELTG